MMMAGGCKEDVTAGVHEKDRRAGGHEEDRMVGGQASGVTLFWLRRSQT